MNFAFLEKQPPTRSRAQHIEDVRREGFRIKLKHIADDCERAQDYCRDMIKGGSDVSDELKQLAATGHALVLVAALLKRQQVE